MPKHLNYLGIRGRLEKRAARRAELEAQVKQQAQCEGKVPYASYADAEKHSNFSAGIHGSYLRPYKCPTCHKYHVGMQAKVFPLDALYQSKKVKSIEELLAEDQQEDREDEADVA